MNESSRNSFSFSAQLLLGTNDTSGVCSGGKGGSPSTTAAVMVRVFRGRIPTAAHVGSCTAEGVLLEI